MSLDSRSISRIVKKVLKEQEEGNSVESLFTENNVEIPAGCKSDPNKVPSVDIKACVKETFTKAQGFLKVLEQLSDMEPGLKTQSFDLPIGESKRGRRRN
jgi:inhibitor of KinA sporulation pathway (predicted exonuclease)